MNEEELEVIEEKPPKTARLDLLLEFVNKTRLLIDVALGKKPIDELIKYSETKKKTAMKIVKVEKKTSRKSGKKKTKKTSTSRSGKKR